MKSEKNWSEVSTTSTSLDATMPVPSRERSSKSTNRLKRYVNWAFFLGAFLYTLFHAGFVIWNTTHNNERFLNIVYRHFGAIVVLPFAGYAALGLVMLLESRSEQPIEFKAIGFEFKGASAPIVLWVLCFVAISICLRLMWQTE